MERGRSVRSGLSVLARTLFGGTMKILIATTVLILVMAGAADAHDRALHHRRYSPAIEQFTYSFAAIPLLPRRHHNHCGYDAGHFICEDHCGIGYQVYSCSKVSNGCCHVGRGYCDNAGHLQCSPALF
jgi:hypothetical protein